VIPPGKEIQVKIWIQLITAGTILALAVPVAASAAAGKGIAAHGATSIATHHKIGQTTSVKLTSPTPVAPPVTFVQGPPVHPSVESQQQICRTQGAGCTSQQYCDYWKINCNIDPASGSSADPLSPESRASGGSTTIVDPAEALAQLENDNCCNPIECMSVV
jgi:hypothetical protein